uniref:Cytochrome P450 n=1 Tax=Acrobeloides nanus TaxID=290746 RepID=A0A914DDI0_9BILA
MPTVDDSVNVMMTHLKKVADSGKAFNIHPYFHELTMDVICRIAMGQRGTRQFENPHVDVCKRVFAHFGVDRLSTFAFLFPFDWFIWCLRRFAFVTANLRKAPFKELLDILRKEIKERKELRVEGKNVQEGDRIDFIDLFLDAEASEISDHNGDYMQNKGSLKVAKKMTTDEIGAQCFVFLLAGFDTTANTLANTMFFLAKDPERQKILQSEIDEVCSDEDVTYEQLQSLKYGDAVMKEALRMIPIAAL